MECVGLGVRNFAAMTTVSFCPTLRSQRIRVTRKQSSFRRCSLYRHLVRVKAGSAGSESCVAVDFKDGFSDKEDFVKAGGSELLFVQMQQNKLMDKQSKLADKLAPIGENVLDLVVIGCGPAGLALAAESAKLGLKVGLIGPDLPFTNNYGVWEDEFNDLGLEGCIEHVWQDTIVYLDDNDPIFIGRAYGRVSRHFLHEELLRRCVESGVSYLSSRVESIVEATDGHRLVACEHDIVVPCRLATVASGAASGKLLQYEVGGPKVCVQTAYGVEVEVENNPYDPSLMVFMDYRDYNKQKVPCLEAEYPTFLYAMPMSPTRVFFEETCLASKEAMPFGLLKKKLFSRLQTMGIRIIKTYEEEWSYIPVGGSLPNTEQKNLAFGAAASMVHPATGYSVVRSLSEAPKYASVIANILKQAHSKDALTRIKFNENISMQAWNSLWPQERKRQRAFFLFGLALIVELDIEASKPASQSFTFTNSIQFANLFHFLTMNSISKPESRSPSLSKSSASASTTSTSIQHDQVPGLGSEEIHSIANQTFRSYSSSSSSPSRTGKGTAIVWFRNDLRVLDNEALYKAWLSSHMVLPVYCIDPRLFSTTYSFGFPKTGALRAQFLIECLDDLKKNLIKYGLNLLIRHGKPEEIIPSLAKAFEAHTVYAQKETCSEEVNVERLVSSGLRRVVLQSSSSESRSGTFTNNPKLQLIWGTTMYHIDDLPFDTGNLPDVYTQFRKSVEAKCTIRSCIKTPTCLGPPPSIDDWGCVPSIDQLGVYSRSQNVSKGMKFVGGESAALGRVNEYIWKKDLLRMYKETRNGMLGPDYSTKFSPWLASGSLSPRFIYEEVKRYEKEREANNSTYWVLFELIWRDYFRFLSVKYGNSLFHIGGPRKVEHRWSQDKNMFEYWRDGRTGYPLIDANMKELSTTGFMSNRGRQIVCSFLVRDMGIDWRMGAEWFETCLLDYDPCSNYGNWTYGAGVGNDPREDRYFSIPKQAQTYDPEGEYVAYWLPQLRALPKDKRNFPGKSYVEQVVPLKFKTFNKHNNRDMALTARQTNFRERK